jgi:SAM-dependent methyltransferase
VTIALAALAAAGGAVEIAGYRRACAGVSRLDRLAEVLTLAQLQRELALARRPGERVAETLLEAMVEPGHRAHLRAVVEMLVGAGLLRRHGGQLELGPNARAALVDRDALRAELDRGYPGLDPFVALLDRVVPKLVGLWRGATHAFQLLPVEVMRGVYGGNPLADRANRAVAACVRAALPAGRRAAILEVGAGSGATAEQVLAAAGDSVEYVFTDVSPGFFPAARARLDRRGLRFAPLDIDRDPAAQGFAQGAFDAIIETNAVHVAARIERAVGHLRGLLRPGGLLVLSELTRVHSLWTVCAGIFDGWWQAEDARLAGSPLLDRAGWRRALAPAFTEIAFVDEAEGAYGQDVILAR